MRELRPGYSLIDLPDVVGARGTLTFAEEPRHIPFTVRRMFLLHHLPAGVTRGGHAHREQHQFLVMTSGSVHITMNDGRAQETVALTRPGQGLYCPPMLWLDLANFSRNAACLCLASGIYDESDYIRDVAEFRKLTSGS